MKENEILEEIHRIRAEHAAECGYDVKAGTGTALTCSSRNVQVPLLYTSPVSLIYSDKLTKLTY